MFCTRRLNIVRLLHLPGWLRLTLCRLPLRFCIFCLYIKPQMIELVLEANKTVSVHFCSESECGWCLFFFFFTLQHSCSVQCSQDRLKYCRGAAVMTPRCWLLVLLLLTCSMKIYNVGSRCDLSSCGLSRRTSMKVQAVCALKHTGAQPFPRLSLWSTTLAVTRVCLPFS